MNEHIEIRISCCAECPFAKLQINTASPLISEQGVTCSYMRCTVGTVAEAMKGIYSQCSYKRSTDIADILGKAGSNTGKS